MIFCIVVCPLDRSVKLLALAVATAACCRCCLFYGTGLQSFEGDLKSEVQDRVQVIGAFIMRSSAFNMEFVFVVQYDTGGKVV
jgi:hypothetical protein